MRPLFRAVDDFLRARGRFAVDAPASGRLGLLLRFIVLFGTGYGVVMGTFSAFLPGHALQLIYSGVKVPCLLLVTFGLCLPPFFVLNTVAGLRDDFREALGAIIATQACCAVVLAGLAPLTAFFYASCADYQTAILFNLLVFATAWTTAQRVVRRYYAPLIAHAPVHRRLLTAWFVLYGFVGVQMAWVLRPFVGAPDRPVQFFREGAWGNAYVVLAAMVRNVVGKL